MPVYDNSINIHDHHVRREFQAESEKAFSHNVTRFTQCALFEAATAVLHSASYIMVRRRFLCISLSLLGLFLLGTVVVLSSVSYYLAIDPAAYLSDLEVPVLDNVTRWNATQHGQVERIPRILHQTWKSETLPVQWQNVSQGCRKMMPD